MQTENISGIYWSEIDRAEVSALGDKVEGGEAVKVATFAGIGSEYIVYVIGDHYEAYEFPMGGPANGTGRVWKCHETWQYTRIGFVVMLTYMATVVADALNVEGVPNF